MPRGRQLVGLLAVSLLVHVLLLTLPAPGHNIRVSAFPRLVVNIRSPVSAATTGTDLQARVVVHPEKTDAHIVAHSVKQSNAVLAPAPVPIPVPSPAVASPVKVEGLAIMVAVSDPLRWGSRPPSQPSQAEMEYLRMQQARQAAEFERHRTEQQARQLDELVRRIGEALAVYGTSVADGECVVAEGGNLVKCSTLELQLSIKGGEEILLGLGRALRAIVTPGAVLMRVQSGQIIVLPEPENHSVNQVGSG